MMMLVVVLHSSVSFLPNAPDTLWPYRDPQPTLLAAFLAIPIQMFVMPTFFVMAGFFAALIYAHRGARGFVANRGQAIALPLVVGWFVIFPVETACFFMGEMRSPGMAGQAAPAAMATAFLQNPWANPMPNYFWFLYYLLIFYVLALGLLAVLKVVPNRIGACVDALAQGMMFGRLRILLLPTLAVLTWWSMLPMAKPGLLIPDKTFMPQGIALVSYGIYFFFGWIMFRHKEFIETLKPRAGTRFCVGLACLLVAVGLAFNWYHHAGDGRDMTSASLRNLLVITQGVIALTSWIIILGGIGLAQRWLQGTHRVVQYGVGAAFWVYLTHLPVCVLIIVLMRDWHAPGALKLVLAITLTFAVVLLAYEAVRTVLPKQKRPARAVSEKS